MKNWSLFKRIVAFLLLLSFVLPVVSCGTPPEESQSSESDTLLGDNTEVETKYDPEIEVKDYDTEFNILIGGTYAKNTIYAENMGDGVLSDAVYERGVNVKNHLGVTLVCENTEDAHEYAGEISRQVSAGDDAYQLVLTHAHIGVTGLITSGALYDIGQLDAVNLDAPYWASEIMEDLKVGDEYLMGYNDFCLAHVHCMIFNKDLLEEYKLESPYDLVRNKEWTLAKLMEMSSKIAVDNGDGKWDETDLYGFSGWGWTYLISFIISSDMNIIHRDEEGKLKVAYADNAEKMHALVDTVFELYNAEYSYVWPSGGLVPELNFANGNALFQLYSVREMPVLLDSEVRVGVLPYPMYDKNQTEYRNMSWNGIMGVPGAIKNKDMVGEVLELLAYYSDPVEEAYYETLLGMRISEAPDDVEMLRLIWDTQVHDVGLIAGGELNDILYMLPRMCERGNNTFSSFVKSCERASQRVIDRLFKQ